MRLSLLLLASIATLSFAQQVPPAPTMLSVVQNANNQFATLTWTASYTCPDAVCWFSLYRDAETDAFGFEFDRGASAVYNFPVYFGEEMGYGTHSFYVQHNNFDGPSPSSNIITVTFTAPPPVNPPSDIVGDPQFMGLKGQVYQVHGAPNEVFNIISDVDLQYNSKFVYLDAGDCPTMDGEKVDTACFTHPGTYLGELGLETQSGDRVYIKAGAAQYGLASVKLNGKHVPMNELIELSPSGFIIRNNSHVLTMQAGNFRLEFTNSDMFVNQVVEMLDTSRTTSHGLLGQSWSTKVHNPKASIPWIEGTVWDYEVEDHKVFSNKFTFNKFTGKANSQPDVQSKAPASIAELKKQVKNRLLKNKQ